MKIFYMFYPLRYLAFSRILRQVNCDIQADAALAEGCIAAAVLFQINLFRMKASTSAIERGTIMSEGENYKFFSHKNCEFFPCHSGADAEEFNCLFCYCPLYVLGRECGGNYVYSEDGIKDCSCCKLPHKPQSYETIINRYGEIMEIVRKQGKTNEKKDESP